VLLELNPGIGGEEAKLFTLDMYEMYARYAAYKGWTFSTETLKQSDNGMVKCYIV
jgi:peptide chain release factor 1